jgi:hypothetical protein
MKMDSTIYVPGTHTKAETLARKIAKSHGYKLKFNSRGDFKAYQRRRFKGIIVNIDSLDKPGTPSPVASLSIHNGELEVLRSAINDAFLAAGILNPA